MWARPVPRGLRPHLHSCPCVRGIGIRMHTNACVRKRGCTAGCVRSAEAGTFSRMRRMPSRGASCVCGWLAAASERRERSRKQGGKLHDTVAMMMNKNHSFSLCVSPRSRQNNHPVNCSALTSFLALWYAVYSIESQSKNWVCLANRVCRIHRQ